MLQWLEDRIQLRTQLRKFLEEPLPQRIGWPHVLGSILLFLFVLQFITGILLSLVYAPSPLSAYQSVQYISYELPGGDWLRALHYWGASLILVVLGLHMARTFLYAAYRKPRELTWIAGVLLLLCTLGFAQSGFLLPWDQKAFWGTQVTIEILRTVPIVGSLLAHLIRGGAQVGALTLSRFFTIHSIVLPLVTLLLILAHLSFVRRYGITPPWSGVDEKPPKEIPFYPFQMAKDATAVFLILVLLFVFAALLPAPLGAPADPLETTFIPRPDWYFLFLFESLKYFPGKTEVIGTFMLPSAAILLLFLLPFIDKNPSRRLRDRPIALTMLFASIALWSYLTYAAVQDEPPRGVIQARGIIPPQSERIKRPSEVGGLYVLKQRCFECHSMTVLGPKPDLQTLARRNFPTGDNWIKDHFQKQSATEVILDPKEVEEILSVLRLVTGDNPQLLSSIPASVRLGAHMFYNKSCIRCHKIDGQGAQSPDVPAPDLTLRPLRTKSWHVEHIRDPQTVVPNSKMPPFLHYEDYEYSALADYILYLHSP